MSSLSMPKLAFTCFPDLPTELRLKIWEVSHPLRLLDIRVVSRDRRFRPSHLEGGYSRIGYSGFSTFRSSQPPPALLFVTRESRQAGLMSYIVIEDHYGPCFFFNPRVDTLDVSRLRYDEWLPMAENIAVAFPEYRVRSLAIHLRDLNFITNLAMGSDAFLLEELFIVRRPGSSVVGGGFRAVREIIDGDTMSLGPFDDSLIFNVKPGLFTMLKESKASLFPSKAVPVVKAVLEEFWECSSFAWPMPSSAV